MRPAPRLRPLRRLLIAAAAVAGFALLALPAVAAKDDLDLVSRAPGAGGAGGDGSSYRPAISADGRYVAFDSDADNLSAEDDNAVSNVFVRDLQTGTTTLVSRAKGAGGAGGDDDSFSPSISADGRYVAFHSDADNLSAEDDNAVSNVFVRDLQTGTTTLVSRAPGFGGAGGDDASFDPSISADGRFVAFHSSADNLSAEDDNAVANVFVRDLQAGTTTLASRAPGFGGAGGDGSSYLPAISADGRFVAFDSGADNLSAEDDDAVINVFVRDLQAGTTTLASRAPGAGGAGADGSSLFAPAISADGRYVAFGSFADNLSAEDNNAVTNIFVRDLQSDLTTLVSRAPGAAGAGGDGSVFTPSISADGRYVAFDSFADNLSAEDDNAVSNVFVRDLQAGTTTLASRAPGAGGAGGDDDSFSPSISADGRFVAFRADADNLSAEDNDAFTNVFRRDVLGLPPPPPPAPPAPEVVQPTAAPGPVVRCDGRVATIVGTSGPDTLSGTPGPDVIASLAGNDIVRGGGGNDRICLGAGADRGAGGAGADRIFGQQGNDRLDGNAANDRLDGGPGNDRLRGQSGNDRAYGRAGRDTAQGGAGNDRLFGNAGRDRLLGGSGRDLARGGTGNDRLFGNAGRDRLLGGSGRDLARGGTGNDRLFGGSGPDRLFGERGNDRLSGGSGLDRSNGGPGSDRCSSEISILC